MLVPLAGCSSSATTGGSGVTASAGASGGAATGSVGASVSGSASGSPSVSGVDCSGTSCTLTLTHSNAQASVLGATVALSSLSNGQATVTVGGHSVSCTQGQTVSAGPLHLECSTVTADEVVLRASLG